MIQVSSRQFRFEDPVQRLLCRRIIKESVKIMKLAASA